MSYEYLYQARLETPAQSIAPVTAPTIHLWIQNSLPRQPSDPKGYQANLQLNPKTLSNEWTESNRMRRLHRYRPTCHHWIMDAWSDMFCYYYVLLIFASLCLSSSLKTDCDVIYGDEFDQFSSILFKLTEGYKGSFASSLTLKLYVWIV